MKTLKKINWRSGLAELAIIVVGVLIALAVNDWYAGVQQRSQEIGWVNGIHDDLDADRRELQEMLEETTASMEIIRELVSSIDDPTYEVTDTLAYLRKLKRATVTGFFRPTETTYTELTGGGSLSTISNRSLVRAVIDYHRQAHLSDDLNDMIREVKWFEYNEALAQVIEPTLLADMTEDWHRRAGLWPPDSGATVPEPLTQPIDFSRLRSSAELRTALARSLDLTVVQRGDLFRMLLLCEEVLEMAERELQRLTN